MNLNITHRPCSFRFPECVALCSIYSNTLLWLLLSRHCSCRCLHLSFSDQFHNFVSFNVFVKQVELCDYYRCNHRITVITCTCIHSIMRTWKSLMKNCYLWDNWTHNPRAKKISLCSISSLQSLLSVYRTKHVELFYSLSPWFRYT